MYDRICEAYPELETRIIITTGIYYKKSTLASIWKLVRESSILFCVVRAIEMYWNKVRGKTLLPAIRSSKTRHIFVNDVNGPQAVRFAEEFAPDLLVSLYTMHIYKNAILRVPALGAINSHPSILPNYRGLEVFFWAMANGDTEVGSSVFFLNEKLDHGAVLDERMVPISNNDSMQDVYNAITESAAEMLITAICSIDEGTYATRMPEGEGSYYPMPTREAVRAFRRRGYRFF